MIIMDNWKSIRRVGAICGALLGLLVFPACKTSLEPDFPEVSTQTASAGAADATPAINKDTTPTTNKDATPTINNNAAELIHVGDSLTVVFSDLPTTQPQLQVQVDENGKITLIENQTFTAVGKTRAELEKEIRDRYVPQIYTKMTVTISRPERLFYVGGEVKNPGRQSYIGPITVLKAIQSAGDFTDFAQRKRVRLTHLNGKTEIINCIKAREDPKLDLPVIPGDTIHVPRRIF
jgi:protein involved in polysaccharide export with SLBB domain